MYTCSFLLTVSQAVRDCGQARCSLGALDATLQSVTLVLHHQTFDSCQGNIPLLTHNLCSAATGGQWKSVYKQQDIDRISENMSLHQNKNSSHILFMCDIKPKMESTFQKTVCLYEGAF